MAPGPEGAGTTPGVASVTVVYTVGASGCPRWERRIQIECVATKPMIRGAAGWLWAAELRRKISEGPQPRGSLRVEAGKKWRRQRGNGGPK